MTPEKKGPKANDLVRERLPRWCRAILDLREEARQEVDAKKPRREKCSR